MGLKHHPLFVPYLAVGAVCLIWGTTYLAIRMALESFPPLVLVGMRFVLSGTILLVAARLSGVRMPVRRDVFYSALFGVIALGIGNGCLTFSEQSIPSSLAALLVTTSPFWMAGIEASLPHGEPLRLPVAAGMLVGFGGTALLVGPSAWTEGLDGPIVQGFLILQMGCFSWGFGSILQRRMVGHVNAVVNGAIQQLAAGIAFLIPALLTDQDPIRWSLRGVSAFFYLIFFGSIIAYSSYIYALKKLPVAVVTIHTYVNPVVAALLGWLFYREPFGIRETAAMGVIFIGVAIVKRSSSGWDDRQSPLRATAPQEPKPTCRP